VCVGLKVNLKELKKTFYKHFSKKKEILSETFQIMSLSLSLSEVSKAYK
jgi:hypothetical protein